MGLAAELSPAVRSVEDQRVSSDRVSLFELLPDLESQEWPWLSPPQPGASQKFPRRVRTGQLRRPEKPEKLTGSEKLAALVDCVGKPLLCQWSGGYRFTRFPTIQLVDFP
jgi:hypothetical protein